MSDHDLDGEPTGDHEVIRPEVVGRSNRDDFLGEVTGVDGTALLAFCLAISSWLILPVIGAIAALVISPGAKRRIRRSGGAVTGMSLVVSAQVISILNLLLGFFIVWGIVALLQWIF